MNVHRESNSHKDRARHSKILDEGDRLISQIKQHLVTYDTKKSEQEANSLTNLKDAGIELGKLIESAQELIAAHSLLYHQEMIERDMASLQWKHSDEVVYSGRKRQLDTAFTNFSNRVNSLINQMGGFKWD
jgi:hypothetical protein